MAVFQWNLAGLFRINGLYYTHKERRLRNMFRTIRNLVADTLEFYTQICTGNYQYMK